MKKVANALSIISTANLIFVCICVVTFFTFFSEETSLSQTFGSVDTISESVGIVLAVALIVLLIVTSVVSLLYLNPIVYVLVLLFHLTTLLLSYDKAKRGFVGRLLTFLVYTELFATFLDEAMVLIF